MYYHSIASISFWDCSQLEFPIVLLSYIAMGAKEHEPTQRAVNIDINPSFVVSPALCQIYFLRFLV